MQPPRFAAAVLRWCSPASDADAILGDLSEEYVRVLNAGAAPDRARRWYWRQVLSSAHSLLVLRMMRAGRETRLVASGLAVAAGLLAILAVFASAGALGDLLSRGWDAGASPGVRLLESVAAFTAGGYVTACFAKSARPSPVTALAVSCLAISLAAVFPVLPIVASTGPAAVAYHALLLALVAPSVLLGASLRNDSSTWPGRRTLRRS